MDNICKLLGKIGDSSYLSHETLGEKMTSGFGGRILRGLVSAITRSKSHQHFHSEQELKDYFERRGLKEIKNKKSDSNYLFEVKNA
jgi:hypothetical protein